MTLNVTNGDSAAATLSELGIRGDILPWRDVLHEGPVPAGLDPRELAAVRARFIVDSGWAESVNDVERDLIERDARLARAIIEGEEVILWFEHDLYDQLQLLQILDRFAYPPDSWRSLSLVQSDDFLAPMDAASLRRLLVDRMPLDRQRIDSARAAWAAVSGDDPSRLNGFTGREIRGFPHLPSALRRLSQEYPWTTHGLSRTEAQALEALAGGAKTADEVFRAVQTAEQAAFLGDSVFGTILRRLSSAAAPLLTLADGSAFDDHRARGDSPALWSQPLRITAAGRRVLAAEQDYVVDCGVDRWIGGVDLKGRSGVPRWNPARAQLEDSSVG